MRAIYFFALGITRAHRHGMLVENRIAINGSLPPWPRESPPSNPRRSWAGASHGGRPPTSRRPPGTRRPFQPDRHGPPFLQPWRRHSGRDGRKRPTANEDELCERAGHAPSTMRRRSSSTRSRSPIRWVARRLRSWPSGRGFDRDGRSRADRESPSESGAENGSGQHKSELKRSLHRSKRVEEANV